MKIEDRHKNIVLSSISFCESRNESNISIRSLVSITKLTEREIEIAVSSLILDKMIKDPNEILNPNTQLALSLNGSTFLKKLAEETEHDYGSFTLLSSQFDLLTEDQKELDAKVQIDYHTAYTSHVWRNTGSYESGAGSITRSKWFPMGSFCRRCGIVTRDFKRKPIICPKQE